MIFNDLKLFLEKIDHYRDEVLFIFIKPYWPHKITPNQITYLRIIISILLFVLLFFLRIENKPLIIFLFCFGALTDLLDGSVSRAFNKTTEFGAMLDPIADRILIIPIAFYILYQPQRWLLLILILLEIISALFSIYLKSKKVISKANIFGKTKMVLLSLVFIAILIYFPEQPAYIFIEIIWISLIFSILSIFTKLLELNNKGYIKNKAISKKLDKYYENI
jgi:CDP-diacylglycerol--glycerol-3-phosphate 3-phosphatidyltransferase